MSRCTLNFENIPRSFIKKKSTAHPLAPKPQFQWLQAYLKPNPTQTPQIQQIQQNDKPNLSKKSTTRRLLRSRQRAQMAILVTNQNRDTQNNVQINDTKYAISGKFTIVKRLEDWDNFDGHIRRNSCQLFHNPNPNPKTPNSTISNNPKPPKSKLDSNLNLINVQKKSHKFLPSSFKQKQRQKYQQFPYSRSGLTEQQFQEEGLLQPWHSEELGRAKRDKYGREVRGAKGNGREKQKQKGREAKQMREERKWTAEEDQDGIIGYMWEKRRVMDYFQAESKDKTNHATDCVGEKQNYFI